MDWVSNHEFGDEGYKYALLIPMIGDQLIGFAGPLVEQGTCIIKVGMIGLKEGWLVAVAGVEAEGGMMLEKNIYRPSRCPAGLAPNSAIANQAEYPSHLSVEKYKGLRSIPSGHIIQWQNILLQLAMPIVDFRREETSLIVLQAMYQTGPSNDDKSMPLRQAHSVLDCAEFCAKLVGQLQLATRRINQN
ncbi:uncharacterized protein PpBr36_11159 [Pyricularia pennisetigena]|uniref:uncharacterized protein n=1 Tax=Pyricularia pennisetigena TaxID=1578925 RepID=UPI0011522790|nr:uncharacterized protein PpBr36_11159 [Pyricularia pennisetigena]TLS20498.1 hypothetical protein PpBr36_11159 [Pyricularia pennisetigena]